MGQTDACVCIIVEYNVHPV